MIIFFGPVGAGKSVQGKMLGTRFNWRWISTGDMFRASKDAEIQATIASGRLISSEQTYQVLASALEQVRGQQIILDGFPRKLEQVQWLFENQEKYDYKIDLVIVIDVEKSEILKRLSQRGRADDDALIIEDRLKIYHTEVTPILQYFTDKTISVVHVEGAGGIDKIHNDVVSQVTANNLDS